MDSVADIAEVHAISAFRVKLSSVGECSWIYKFLV
jgi:hypothetical protein